MLRDRRALALLCLSLSAPLCSALAEPRAEEVTDTCDLLRKQNTLGSSLVCLITENGEPVPTAIPPSVSSTSGSEQPSQAMQVSDVVPRLLALVFRPDRAGSLPLGSAGERRRSAPNGR